MTTGTEPRILAWAALGMRDAGIGQYVELRDYERLKTQLEQLRTGVKALQRRCCDPADDLCHGCKALLQLVKS